MILALSASKSSLSRVFNQFNLNDYFTHKVSGEDFVKSKPDPTIFIHATSLSKNKVEECIVIEDSTNGVKAACAAGIYCLGYNSENSKLQNLEGASVLVDYFFKVNADFIKNLK